MFAAIGEHSVQGKGLGQGGKGRGLVSEVRRVMHKANCL